MADNSDYNKPRINMFDKLPTVYQSDANRSLFENLFNRYITKDETEKVVGTIGVKNEGAVTSTQILEETQHRQAFQLQPLIYQQVATVEHLSSYKDVLAELTRLGVDSERLPLWGNAEQFNFIPPIDLDKLINYQDYYWYDPADPLSTPQYITIQNKCTKAQASLNTALEQLGGTDEYPITALNGIQRYIRVDDNYQVAFPAGSEIDIINSTNNNGRYTVNSSVFDGTYTFIFVAEPIDDTIIDGRVSVEFRIIDFYTARDCACDGQAGWDMALWDDNDGHLATPPPPPIGLDPEEGHEWDESSSCGEPQTNDWALDNKWVHRVDIPNLSIARRAELPIIEFLPDLELNEWTVTDHQWSYRPNDIATRENVDTEPSDAEIFEQYTIDSIPSAKVLRLSIAHGDISAQFTSGQGIAIETAPTTYMTVDSAAFVLGATEITTIEDVPGLVVPTDTLRAFDLTSRGDPWIDFETHWRYVDVKEVRPIDNQIENTVEWEESYVVPHTASQNMYLVDIEGNIAASNPTGLLNDPTVYTAQVISNGTPCALNITGSTAQNFTQLINEINIDLDAVYGAGNVVASFVNGDIRIQNTSAPWNIIVNDIDLFNSLNGYVDLYPAQTIFNFDTYTTHVLKETDGLRVYVDDHREYALFKELTTGDYVTGIEFFDPLPENTRVRVEIHAAAESDVGREQVLLPTEPAGAYELISLVKYRHVEQTKPKGVHQYPLYNIYNVDGTFADEVNEIFKFITSSDSPVDSNTGLRLYTTDSGQNYHFEQLLVNEDTGVMKAYRDYETITSENILGLQTIWRIGDGDAEEYVPEKVDEDRNSDPLGDWEIPNQLYYNASHDNKRQLSYSELFTHFNSIIDSQEAPSGFGTYSSIMWRLLPSPNYGRGGTIKEHNYSYDTMLSSIFIKSSNPLDIIEFAQNRYEINLSSMQEIFKTVVFDEMQVLSNDHYLDLAAQVAETTINTFEINDFNGTVFGDSNTYNWDTDEGIKSFIATLPFIRLALKHTPYWNIDEELGIYELSHHDGHLFQTTIEDSFVDQTIQLLIDTDFTDADPSFGKWCWEDATDPVTNWNTYYLTAPYYGISGKYWYNNVTETLYRFSVEFVGDVTPPTSSPEGSLWYNTTSELLYRLESSTWNILSTGPADVTDAWLEVDLHEVFRGVMLEVETRLFEAAPDITEATFDFDSLLDELTVFEDLEEQAFFDHVKRAEIQEPFSVEGYYDEIDPLTWNYKGVEDVGLTAPQVIYPTTTAITEQPWGATWWDIYEQIFNTPYPHLEPWKLQGYTEKPDWWDEEYLLEEGLGRRWDYDHSTGKRITDPLTDGMWFNVRQGRVPPGRPYPNGFIAVTGNPVSEFPAQPALPSYQFVCVNIDDVAVSGYEPDSLLPPFVSGLVDVTNRSLMDDITYIPNDPAFFPGITLIYDDYIYGDNGPVEWTWRKSSQYLYDISKIAFKMQPVRFLHYAFGNDYHLVGGLNVDQRLEQVFSHKDTDFHGDLIDNETYIVEGLNQWYTNFNRFNAYDNKTSDFRELWTEWDAKLAYQFGSTVDDQSFDIVARTFDLTDQDYKIVLKRSPAIINQWVDSLQITITQFGPRRIVSDDASEWEFSINVPATVGRTLSYYDVDTNNPRSTFVALGGATTDQVWTHYTVTDTVLTANAPFNVTGMQNVINFVDGYVAWLQDQGFVFNDSTANEVDEDTGRQVSWQVELERFINSGYGLRNAHYNPLSPSYSGVTIELNPLRNYIWIEHPDGILADVERGPYPDIATQQTIYDQYGRTINGDNFHVFREDERSFIQMMPEIANDIEPNTTSSDYGYLHIGGMQIFIDGYEHVVLFNDYTITDNLVYDPFLGLDTVRFAVEFDRHGDRTQRPNAGGFFLHENNLVRNIENIVDNLQGLYDVLEVGENNVFAQNAQDSLGYEYKEYFDHVSVNDRSKFLFWRGLIQQKGTINAIKAFINSRRFEDTKIDEYWAYKAADYGSGQKQIYPELNLFANDTRNNALRFHFTDGTAETGFVKVTGDDEDRWYEQPNQETKFVEGADNLFFDGRLTKLVLGETYEEGVIDSGERIITLSEPADALNVTFFQGDAKNTAVGGITTTMTVSPYVMGTDNLAVFVDGVLTYDYVENSTTEIEFSPALAGTEVVVVIRKTGLSFPTKYNAQCYGVPLAVYNSAINIYAVNPANSKLGPGKLIDHVNGIVIKDVPIWDPARDELDPLVVNGLDMQMDLDPASYNYSFLSDNIDPTENFWGDNEVGTVWFDNLRFEHIPYYDEIIYSVTNNRIFKWGTLADWGDPAVYEWTKSETHPSSFADDGTPIKHTYKRERERDLFTLTPSVDALLEINLDVSYFGQLHDSDLTGLTFAVHTAVIEVDGTPYNIEVEGAFAQSYGELIDLINNDLGGSNVVATLTPSNGITFRTDDTTITNITVTDTTLFESLTVKDDTPVEVLSVEDASVGSQYFVVDGDKTATYTAGREFTIENSNQDVAGYTNDGSYTTLSSDYNVVPGKTRIFVSGGINFDTTTPAGYDSSTDSFGLVTPIYPPIPIYISNTATPATDAFFVLNNESCHYPNMPSIAANDAIFVGSDDTLPSELSSGVVYYVLTGDFPTQWKIAQTMGGAPLRITDAGTGNHLMIRKEFWQSGDSSPEEIMDWKEIKDIHELDHFVKAEGIVATITILNTDDIRPCDLVNVYINGIFSEQLEVDASFQITLTTPPTDNDIIRIIKSASLPSEEDLTFDPTEEDDGTRYVQYMEDYDYVEHVVPNEDSSTYTTYYYFWIRNKITKDIDKLMSPNEMERQLGSVPEQYMFYQDLIPTEKVTITNGQTVILPDRYTQSIIRGVVEDISIDDQFKFRFIQDFTLRDDYDDGDSPIDLKTKHEEWILFRQGAETKVPEYLWDKMTESIIGSTLDTFYSPPRAPVPDPARELYDEAYNTSTRIGFGEGQTFVDRDVAVNTIVSLIEDPSFDTFPVNKETFFATYNFDTPENSKDTIDFIYDNFATTQVNLIFFEVMHDALTLQPKYAGLMKTSLIAATGIRVLEADGTIDDF